MNLYLIVFTSEAYKEEKMYECHKDLFLELETSFTLHLIYFKDASKIPGNAYKIAFIANGDVENIVIQNFSILPYPITLLTDGLYNSLPSALEIAAWIRAKNLQVNIIHGAVTDMAEQVLCHHRAFATKRALKGKRIGVIGIPSPYLIASHVDYLLAGQRWGINYIDIPIEEVYKRFYQITNDEIGVEASLFATNAKACQEASPDDLLKAMRLHKAVKSLCEQEHLDAITLSDSSFIRQLKVSGCVTASLLNNEGIPTSSEGDLQAIITSLMAYTLTGQPSFMGNPSFIDKNQNEIILTHCSIPTKMTEDYIIRSHFETKIGIGIQGLMHEGEVTLFKCGGECLDEYYVTEGYLTENTNYLTYCRTQVKIKLNKPVSYFFHNPLGHHHILLQGKHEKTIKEFMQQNRCKLIE